MNTAQHVSAPTHASVPAGGTKRSIALRHDAEHGSRVLDAFEWHVSLEVLHEDNVVLWYSEPHPSTAGTSLFAVTNNKTEDENEGKDEDEDTEDLKNGDGGVPVFPFPSETPHAAVKRTEETHADASNKDASCARVVVTRTVVRPNKRRQVINAASREVDLEFFDQTPALQISIHPTLASSSRALSVHELDVRLTLTGSYRCAPLVDATAPVPAPSTDTVRWTSHLSPRAHARGAYEKNSPTSCGLEMDNTHGLHTATSSYTYASPRIWTGITVTISSVAMERVLFRS